MNPRAWTGKQQLERAIALAVLMLVVIWPVAVLSAYWSHTILIETFFFGIAAAEPHVPLRVRRHGLPRADRALRDRRRDHRQPRRRRAAPAAPRRDCISAGTRRSRSSSRSSMTTAIGLLARGGRGTERGHLLPDDHAHLLGDRDLHARPGDEDLRVLGDRRHQQLHAGLDRQHPRPPEPPLLRRARGRDRGLRPDPLRRPDAVRSDAAGRPRRADADELARLQRGAAPDARIRLRRLPRLTRRDPLRLVERPDRAGQRRPAGDDQPARRWR